MIYLSKEERDFAQVVAAMQPREHAPFGARLDCNLPRLAAMVLMRVSTIVVLTSVSTIASVKVRYTLLPLPIA